MIGEVATMRHAPPELSYPGLSPQLLARVRQLWSAQGLDFDFHWKLAIRSMPGFRAAPRLRDAEDSAAVDLVFLFDQCVIWVRALQAAAGCRPDAGGLDPAQWHGLAAVGARLTEQLTALRVLAMTGLPMPAMQIARSVSEDVDMMLVLLARRQLAARFVACRNVDDASEFWRRHIAGGRAFQIVTQKLYDIGLDYSPDTEYGRWRKGALSVLGTAVHTNALPPPASLQNDDSLYFATFRIHELCAYAQMIQPQLTGWLAATASSVPDETASAAAHMAALAAPMSVVLINQIESLSRPAPRHSAAAPPPH